METRNSPASSAAGAPFLSGHKVYVLFVCFLVYTFNYVDRQILIILAEPIKNEFDLRDWQLGFLTGTAFALFYATLGIPIARLADRWHRVNIIAISLAIWSGMTALCGLATNFVMLVMARIGVGIGEAGGSPPASSLLASYFPAHQRSTAMGIYALGPTVGLLLGFVIGGWVNELYGWRPAMLIVGLPGLALALLVKLTVDEPPREPAAGAPAGAAAQPLGATLRYLFGKRTFRWVMLAAVAAGFTVYGFMTWVPVYLIRHFGLNTGEVGTVVGLSAGLAGSAGIFSGGFLADRFARRDARWQMWTPACTMVLFFPLILLVLYAPTVRGAILFLVPAYAVALAYTGPTWAILQSISPPRMRAMAAAILLFLVNLIGLGLGPQLVGVLSDLLADGDAAAGLRSAIAFTAAPALLSALSFFLASRSIDADLEHQG